MLPQLTTSKASFDPPRRTPPPAAASRGILSSSQPTNLDIGFAEPGYVDDSRVYVDDGYDGPGGLGAFSTLVDPDVDLDIGEIRFNTRPPSGQFMAPSASINVMLDLDDDMDTDTRGRHVSRPSQSLRWKSADRATVAATADSGADLRRRASGKDTTSSRKPSTKSTKSQTTRNSSQTTVIMSSLKAHMRPLPLPLTPHYPPSPLPPSPSSELGPIPINMDLEPDMVFSKNPAPFTPTSAVPGVLDLMDFDTGFGPLRPTRSSDWVTQTPSREKSRYPVSGSGSHNIAYLHTYSIVNSILVAQSRQREV
ncbi:hypothetical protein BDP27DRAFT_754140 [Rhodocollybia butyracea]|uniref:Uncharacterized protein n=1 Tax=Rhodocollybia butyracea TaxID=206335 RepID=A0A9P5U7M2_9AGAR|nr:hypothetical protein BDP27DRAFT_754140 [Rhodocollybia butyracea]